MVLMKKWTKKGLLWTCSVLISVTLVKSYSNLAASSSTFGKNFRKIDYPSFNSIWHYLAPFLRHLMLQIFARHISLGFIHHISHLHRTCSTFRDKKAQKSHFLAYLGYVLPFLCRTMPTKFTRHVASGSCTIFRLKCHN
jgi:glycopeptide antibiotics resistance protein